MAKNDKTVSPEVQARENIESLRTQIETAEKGILTLRSKIQEELQALPLGAILYFGDEPYEVREADGKRYIKTMFTRRQMALKNGEPLPPVAKRAPRKSVDGDAQKA